MTTFQKMEACWRGATTLELIEALQDADWRVQYGAAVALGDGQDATAIPPLLAVLDSEDRAPLYTQPETRVSGHAGATEVVWPDFYRSTPPDTLEAWRRRGRLKQAVCLALGQIGEPDSRILELLHRYATDAGEDYTVRAAACQSLGLLAQESSRDVLEIAARDEEWCTKHEAAKALQGLKAVRETSPGST